jgi:hypothetical protein
MKRAILFLGLVLFGIGVMLSTAGLSYYLYLIPLKLNYNFPGQQTYPETFESLTAVGVLLLLAGAGLIVGAIGKKSNVQQS